MGPLLALYSFVLVSVFIAVVFSFFPKEEPLSENLAVSIILSLAILSVSLQGLALAHVLKFNAVIDIGVAAAAILRARSLAAGFGRCLSAYAQGWRSAPLFQLFLTVLSLLLLAEAFFQPPVVWDLMTYHLARIMLMLREGQFFLMNFNDYRQDVPTIGFDMLSALSLRFGTDFGAQLYGWWSFMALALGVHGFALALTGNRVIARACCLLASTLTMVLLHAAIAKNDLILAAVTVIGASSLLRFQQTGHWRHAALAILILLFGINAKISYAAMPILLAGGMAVLVLLGKARFPAAWPKAGPVAAFSLQAAGLATCIGAPLLHNFMRYGHFAGPPAFTIFLHTGGWRGGLVNMGRAWISLLGFPKQVFGDAITQLYDQMLGSAHLAGLMLPDLLSHQLEVDLTWTEPALVWYGLASPVVVAALLWALVQGSGFVRILAASACLYVAYTAIYGIGWDPYNGRYYALAPVVGVLCLAAFLMRLQAWSRPLFGLAVGSCVALALCNSGMVLWYAAIRPAPRLVAAALDRDQAYARTLGLPALYRWFTSELPTGRRVLVMAGEDLPTFPFLLARPDLSLTVGGVPGPFFGEPIVLGGENLVPTDPVALQRIFEHFDDVLYMNRDPSGKVFGVHGFDQVREALKRPFYAPVFAQ
jgi:hypothetical protein